MYESASAQPYIGPRPFETSDRDLFFGRRFEIQELRSLLLASRLFLLHAASGSGKTSLLNAGLRPLLSKELDVLPTARVQIRESPEPEHRSARGGDIGGQNVYTQGVLSYLTGSETDTGRSEASLPDYLAGRPRREGGGRLMPRLLVLDQFEELFTTHPDRWPERKEFLGQLAEALDRHRDLRVLIILREDFLARLLSAADDLFELEDRYALEPLRRPSAEEAIQQPARNHGRRFTAEALDVLVDKLMLTRVHAGAGEVIDIKGEFVEPVQLQVVCSALWSDLPDDVRVILPAHVEQFADLDRSLGSFYDQAVASTAIRWTLSEKRLREWVQNALITDIEPGTRGTVYVGARYTEGMPNEVVRQLEDEHLIRAEWRAGTQWVELAHDSLIGPIKISNRDFSRRPQSGRSPEELVRSATYAMAKAHRLLDACQFAAAARFCEQARAQFAEAGDLWNEAMAWMLLGDAQRRRPTRDANPDALTAYEEAWQRFEGLNDDYWAGEALRAGGDLLQARDHYEEAVSLYDRAIRHVPTPEQVPLLIERGTALVYACRFREAAADFSAALSMESGNMHALGGRGQALSETGPPEAALLDLDRAIKMSKDVAYSATLRSARGLALAKLGRHGAASVAFTASLRTAPDNAWTFWRRARTYAMRGKMREAVRDARTALRRRRPPLSPALKAEVQGWLRQPTTQVAHSARSGRNR
jgi:tetratricopeptide (TPR) repeat protein